MTKKPYKKSEVSRRAVLDAALQTLGKKGYARTSVQDIADAAGLSKGAIHYHFESKDDLLKNVIQHACQRLSEKVKGAWEEPGSPVERIRRAVAAMWSIRHGESAEFRVLSDLMALAVHDDGLKVPIGAMFRANREELNEVFSKSLLELGLKPKVSPRVLPRMLFAALDGMALHQVFDPTEGAEEDAELLKGLEIAAFSLFEL